MANVKGQARDASLHGDDTNLLQKFTAKPGVEALAIAVPPRRPGFNLGNLSANSLDPLSDSLRFLFVVRGDKPTSF